MNKEELALQIIKAIYKGDKNYKSFKAFPTIKKYFLHLGISDLQGIANQYGIKN